MVFRQRSSSPILDTRWKHTDPNLHFSLWNDDCCHFCNTFLHSPSQRLHRRSALAQIHQQGERVLDDCPQYSHSCYLARVQFHQDTYLNPGRNYEWCDRVLAPHHVLPEDGEAYP